MAREAQIEKDLEQKHPELLEIFRQARIAFDKEDYAAASQLLFEVTSKAPDYDVAQRRVGASLARQTKRQEGLKFCEKAVELNRSIDNMENLAYCLVAGQEVATDRASFDRAMGLLKECRTKLGGDGFNTVALTAQLALQLNDQREFRMANAILVKSYPNEMLTHYFRAIEAAMDEHWMRAEKEIKRAGKLGLEREAVERFLSSGVHSRALWWLIVLDASLTFGFWIAGLALLSGLGFFLSKATLRQAQKADVLAAVTNAERMIRKVYRAVLNVAGVYYYISLPVVIVLVIGIAAVIFYGFLMIGRIPIKLMFILGLGALFTVVAMVKSLFIKVDSADPGRPLERSEAGGLWKLTQEVAQSVGTRPIDEIRITPGTELAVYERGSWRQKLRNEAHRILILGTGVLNGFQQNDFRCVLAHEYGHFSNRDTAGGDIAMRVQNDMVKFYLAMRAAGQATLFNAAFHFLRVYNFIFRRISHGATRLQEILADRVAAQIYGAPAFEGGLTHVIKRTLEFEAAASLEIKQSIEGHRPIQNLYELAPPPDGEVATEFAKALTRQTTEDDTHPAPQDRFRLVARLQQPSCPPLTGEVWDLFKDPEGIRREMVEVIEKQVSEHRNEATTETVEAS